MPHESGVLVTGANGFIGSHLCNHLHERGYRVCGTVRKPGTQPSPFKTIIAPTLDRENDWTRVFSGCRTVVHLAARVHITKDSSDDSLKEFRDLNTHATLNLARRAIEQGVTRFLFISSMGVYGTQDHIKPLSPHDLPTPLTPYAISKYEAELGLQALSADTGLELVIIRPPLVYGPGVGANFLRLLRAVDRGLPLPLDSVRNLRSLVYLGNLVDAIEACLENPLAAGKTYLVSDGDDVSTPELIRRLAHALGRTPRLFPIPPALMRLAGRLLDRGEEIDRLLGSLAVDSSAIRHDLGWIPPYSMKEGLTATAHWYCTRKKP